MNNKSSEGDEIAEKLKQRREIDDLVDRSRKNLNRWLDIFKLQFTNVSVTTRITKPVTGCSIEKRRPSSSQSPSIHLKAVHSKVTSSSAEEFGELVDNSCDKIGSSLKNYDEFMERIKGAKRIMKDNAGLEGDLSENAIKKMREEGDRTREQVLADERDFKRRRKSYRNRSVHTAKKTHTEVVREFINIQMENIMQLNNSSDCHKVRSDQQKHSSRTR